MAGAVAGGRPKRLRDSEPVSEQGSSPAVPSNPNSRLGRQRSPLAQGRDRMDATVVGIDVSKNQLDVHVRGRHESFVVARDAEGLAVLIERLRPLEPRAIGLEAPEASRASSPPDWRALACRSSWSIRRKCAPSPTQLAKGPRPIRSTLWSSPISSRRPRLKSDRCATSRHAFSPISSPEGARSWR